MRPDKGRARGVKRLPVGTNVFPYCGTKVSRRGSRGVGSVGRLPVRRKHNSRCARGPAGELAGVLARRLVGQSGSRFETQGPVGPMTGAAERVDCTNDGWPGQEVAGSAECAVDRAMGCNSNAGSERTCGSTLSGGWVRRGEGNTQTDCTIEGAHEMNASRNGCELAGEIDGGKVRFQTTGKWDERQVVSRSKGLRENEKAGRSARW